MKEALLLELFERVKALELRVDRLEAERRAAEPVAPAPPADSATGSVPRRTVLAWLQDRIQAENPAVQTVRKGRQAEGGGLFVVFPQRTVHVKVGVSKSYETAWSAGWHTVSATEVQAPPYDVYVFVVTFPGGWDTYWFSAAELTAFAADKPVDAAGLVHFYFHRREGQVQEVRDGIRDVRPYWNRWTVLTELAQKEGE